MNQNSSDRSSQQPPQDEPAQPVALSTLTDMQLAAAAYDGYDDYWTEDSKGIQTEAWAASAKAVLALAAAAPAQQAAPVKLTRYDRDEGGMFPSKSGDWVLYEHYLEQMNASMKVPPGMALVPIEPTPEMIEAAMQVKRVRFREVVAAIRAGKDEAEARRPAIVAEWQDMLSAASQDSAKETK